MNQKIKDTVNFAERHNLKNPIVYMSMTDLLDFFFKHIYGESKALDQPIKDSHLAIDQFIDELEVSSFTYIGKPFRLRMKN